MAYDDKLPQIEIPHNLILEGREKISVSGVSDVARYDENEIVLTTVRGELSIRGSGLHVEKLSLGTGELTAKGMVSDISYEEPAAHGGLWSRLFK